MVEATGDLIGNKITDKITRISKTSGNNLERNEELVRKKCITPKLKQKHYW